MRPAQRRGSGTVAAFELLSAPGGLGAAGVAHPAIARGQLGVTGASRSVAAAAGRADEHAVAALEDVLLAVVHAAAVDAHVAAAAGAAAGQAGGGERRALGHEADDDRARRLALDQHVLAQAAAEAAGAAGVRAHALVVEEE